MPNSCTSKPARQIALYDSTLREGAQSMLSAFSLQDKLAALRLLDELGIPFIEAGDPASNPKDKAFYTEARKISLSASRLVAFGSTVRSGLRPENDPALGELLRAETELICVFGKAWDFHATAVLGVTPEENLDMVYSTIRFLRERGRIVYFDAEHFFDGFQNAPEYALSVLNAAERAGAACLTLCDTNGGAFPSAIREGMRRAMERCPQTALGIHCHNDCGLAVANSIEAALSGAELVQATSGGWGERCGNADLCTLLPDLQIKLGFSCISPEKMQGLARFSREMDEVANLKSDMRRPFVGAAAFSHKAGMHIDAMQKSPQSFEQISPTQVGAQRRYLLSEVAGRQALVARASQFVPELTKDSPETRLLLEKLKQMEFDGYQFEGADASFELLVLRTLGRMQPFFVLRGFKCIVMEPPATDGEVASAMVDITVGGEDEITAAKGNGPVNALDAAARRALERFYPCLRDMSLIDYKVRVLDSENASASSVRVRVVSRDHEKTWATVGVSTDVVNASWKAIVDSIEYKLLHETNPKKA